MDLEKRTEKEKTAEEMFDQLFREMVVRWKLWVLVKSPSGMDDAVKLVEDLRKFIEEKKYSSQ